MRFRNHFLRGLAVLSSGLGLISAAGGSEASYTTQQVLDRIYTYTPADVLDMRPADVEGDADASKLYVQGTALSVCALASINGLYCLDGTDLVNWPEPEQAAPVTKNVVLNCNALSPWLDSKSGPCTALAASQAGAVWIAGKRKSSYSLIKVQKGACTDGGTQVTDQLDQPWCAQEYYSGRPVLADISVIDGDAAENLPDSLLPDPETTGGVLGIEERKNAVFFPDAMGATPIVIATGRDWGLSGNEVLQDVTLLQIPLPGGGGYRSYVLATTSNGRVLAKNAAGGPVRAVYNIVSSRTGTACNASLTPYFGLRASSTATVVYVSDRNYCQITALQPTADLWPGVGASWPALPMPPPAVGYLMPVSGEDGPLILSTAIPGYLDFSPIGLTVAPGISLPLLTCKGQCELVGDGNDGDSVPGAKLMSVDLVPNTPDGAVAFQIKGIPDCRYAGAPDAAFSSEQAYDCEQHPEAVVSPPGCDDSCGPGAKWLNVTPLLPTDVVQAFKASGNRGGVLPPLLISPQYRAQAASKHVFEAFFIITNPKVRFQDTFVGEYDVDDLHDSGTELGCVLPAGPLPLATLRLWDIGTSVSEIYENVGGPTSVHEYVDMLENVGCGSEIRYGGRLSLLPYDLEITPDTYAPTAADGAPVKYTRNNDAVFARLLQKLYGDLHEVQTRYACAAADLAPELLADAPTSSALRPLPEGTCASLESTWQNGLIKLNKCVNAAFQPKSSAGDENCQSFVSQLSNYRSRIPATTSASDIANRTGELKVRVEVLFYVYNTRFLPSIPADGFCRETTCPSP